MKFCAEKLYFATVVAGLLAGGEAFAVEGKLSPQNFNKMYWLAQHGKVDILREAVNRGLNINSVNPNGDTGLCIAIKRNDYVAYNSFRMSGANTRHPCTYKMGKEYREFLENNKAVHADAIVGNEESLYYN
ncbi:MAG: ankyrin repeat domain-containing protein, partial [Alphaproteobacteria bacterium]|nr:ankyrin repeat domain-containing protein [Alphaproteobacteria bacterium]